MATRNFDLAIQATGTFRADRIWTGAEIHSIWKVENMDSLAQSEWGTDTNGWMQYRSALSTHSVRYNDLDLPESDYYFETEMQPTTNGNYELGVHFRYQSRNSFYYVAYNGGYQDWGGKNIRLMKVAGTTHTKIADYTAPVFDGNKAYKIRVVTSGANFKVWMDGVLIFDYTDAFPIPNGAFGPIVKGQRFAKWKQFQALSISAFVIQKLVEGQSVTSAYYDAPTSKLLFTDDVGTIMQQVLDEQFSGKAYTNLVYTRFSLSTPNTRVKPLFNRTASANTTTSTSALIYAYQVLPTTPPPPVTDVLGEALAHDKIRLSWKHVDDSEDGFIILDEAGNTIGSVGENVFTFTEEGLAEATTYHRKIVAYNHAGNSTESAEVLVTTPQQPPNAPSDFAGTALSHSAIEWTWTDNADNETEFELVQWNDLNEAVIVRPISGNATSYTETGLSQLTTYTRGIRAKNAAGVSTEAGPVSVTTLEKSADPPPQAPVNFFGVSTADDTIIWSWEDFNEAADVDGYEVLNEEDVVIARLSKTLTMFVETNLHSRNTYRRKVRAVHSAGGKGPLTTFAVATTLGYGEDFTGKPVHPYSADAQNITDSDALLVWEYTDHPAMPAVGFKIYDAHMDQLIDAVPVTERQRLLQGLSPDTTYPVYVVAFNERGDSIKSNIVTIVTKTEEEAEAEIPFENQLEPLDDPMMDIRYEAETETTPKIKAFHSGIGDGLHLKVQNMIEAVPEFEDFSFEMFIKGRYQGESKEYVDVPVLYRAIVTGTDVRDDGPYRNETPWYQGTVRGPEDDTGVQLKKLIKVQIPTYVTGRNVTIQVVDSNGDPVPKYEEGSTEDIKWITEPVTETGSVTEVTQIYMKNVFTEWTKFSHSGAVQPANVKEMNAWRYSETTDELVCTANTATFVGAVSRDIYTNYESVMRMRSSDRDNDIMAFIIAYMKDSTGREHTLSAVRSHTNETRWGLYYNYRQNTEKLLVGSTDADLASFENWSKYYPKGTRIEIKRTSDLITARTTKPGFDDLGYELTVDLTANPILEIFRGARAIGVAACSQNEASLLVESFTGQRTEVYTNERLLVWTTKRKPGENWLEWEGAKVIGSVKRVNGDAVLRFKSRIQSPRYELPWQEIDKQYEFDPKGYKLIVNCLNPNVELRLDREITDFFPENSMFVDVPLAAVMINYTQTGWSPHIHSGYYYLNQREYFLYAEDKVLPKDEGQFASYVYSFPYVIKVFGERYYSGEDVVFADDTASHFSYGKSDEHISIDEIRNALTLKDESQTGIFLSRLFDFGKGVSTWRAFDVYQNEYAGTSASLVVEVGAANELGEVLEWNPQLPGELINVPAGTERVRYRLTLTAGEKKVVQALSHTLFHTALLEGKHAYTKVVEDRVEITDPVLYESGIFVTKPLLYGDQVENMGTVTMEVRLPSGSAVEFYSATAASDTHDFTSPTAESPWIPLEPESVSGSRTTYKIKSAANKWLAIAMRLHRTQVQVGNTSITFDATSFDPMLAQNLKKNGEYLELVDPSQLGFYQSRPISMPNADGFLPVAVKPYPMYGGDAVSVATVTGSSYDDVTAKAATESNWKTTTSFAVQSEPNEWIMYRVWLKSGSGTTSPQLASVSIQPYHNEYQSPVVNQIVAEGSTFTNETVRPRIDKVSLSGYVEEGFGSEDYVIPMTGELLSDQSFHDVTTDSVETIAWSWLLKQGIANISALTIKDYLAEADASIPVEMSTDPSGKMPVRGRTTDHVGELIFGQEKLYFDAEKQEVILQPVPQTGSPVVIYNAQGKLLRQVHFRDKRGRMTLTNTESHVVDDSRYFFLEHRGIDRRTLRVELDLEGDGTWSEISRVDLIDNRVVMPALFKKGLRAQISYRLQDSFFVDYNYAPARNFARFQVHTTFNPEILETRRLHVHYETNEKHAYYLAEEINLNPLLTVANKGFIYLTDELYPPFKLELKANPNVLYVNRRDKVTINAYVTDEYGNPVLGEVVNLSCQYGSLVMISASTDANGMVTALYESPPTIPSRGYETVEAAVITKKRDHHLSKSLRLDFAEEAFPEKISIVLEKHMAKPGDTVQLKVIATGPNNERLGGRFVTMSSLAGSFDPVNGSTNGEGEFYSSLTIPEDFAGKLLVVQAECTYNGITLKEQNMIGIEV